MMTKHEGKMRLEELFHQILTVYGESIPEMDTADFCSAIAVSLKNAVEIYENFTLREESEY